MKIDEEKHVKTKKKKRKKPSNNIGSKESEAH